MHQAGVIAVSPYRAAQAGGQQEKPGRFLGLALHHELLGEAADGRLHLRWGDRLRPFSGRMGHRTRRKAARKLLWGCCWYRPKPLLSTKYSAEPTAVLCNSGGGSGSSSSRAFSANTFPQLVLQYRVVLQLCFVCAKRVLLYSMQSYLDRQQWRVFLHSTTRIVMNHATQRVRM